MKSKDNRIPSYRLHRQSGQGRVTLNGRDILPGKHGTTASREEYNRVISEWIATGRQATPKKQADNADGLTVSELIARYKGHVEAYYRRADGSPTGEADNIGDALRPLRLMYGKTPAAEFSPLKLKAVRETMIAPKILDPNTTRRGWCRNLINHNTHRICALFSWGVENELVPPHVRTSLREVKVLLRGRSKARESEPVQPVDDEVVDATIPHLPAVVQAMVRVQRLTAARPGEIILMRTGEIDRSAAVWFYLPLLHKTAHHGRVRSIAIGPRAQEIIQPYLKPLNPTACIFNPADATAEMREKRQQSRKTPPGHGNMADTNRKRKPNRQPGDHYSTKALRRAIARACDLAFPVPGDLVKPLDIKKWKRDHRWHPNQLRHSAATAIERKHGLEASQIVLGHSSPVTTKTYVKRNQAAAGRIAAEVG